MDCILRILKLLLFAVSVGISLMLISGAYQTRLFVTDGELVHFGFPFSWLEGGRGKPLVMTPWRYGIIWSGFVLDTLTYSTIVFLASISYFGRRKTKMK